MLILKNSLTELEKLSDAVQAFGTEKNLDPTVIHDASLALEEIFSNIVHHAYDDEDDHRIKIFFRFYDEILELTVQDDGIPFNPLTVCEPDLDTALEDRPIGGLGLHLVRNMMDDLEYRRISGKNRLTMRKRLAPAGRCR